MSRGRFDLGNRGRFDLGNRGRFDLRNRRSWYKFVLVISIVRSGIVINIDGGYIIKKKN